MARQGAVIDFELDDLAEICGPAGTTWMRETLPRGIFGSDEILAASRPLSEGVTQAPGIYFLIWQDLICYVGQAASIYARLCNHVEGERRPVDRVATICGVPKWAQSELEYAYVLGWSPPWNVEKSRSKRLSSLPELLRMAKASDRSRVMPAYCPVVGGRSIFWPTWRQQVLGRIQALGKA